VVLNRDAARNPCADGGACHHDAVVVVDLNPVVIRDAQLFGVSVVDPERLDAARERGHTLVVAVGGVNVPLSVRREVVQHLRRTRLFREPQVRVLGGQRLRLIRRQVLAKLDVGRVIEIEVLAPGEGSPGHARFHVVGKRGVRASILCQP